MALNNPQSERQYRTTCCYRTSRRYRTEPTALNEPGQMWRARSLTNRLRSPSRMRASVKRSSRRTDGTSSEYTLTHNTMGGRKSSSKASLKNLGNFLFFGESLPVPYSSLNGPHTFLWRKTLCGGGRGWFRLIVPWGVKRFEYTEEMAPSPREEKVSVVPQLALLGCSDWRRPREEHKVWVCLWVSPAGPPESSAHQL